MSPVRTSLAVLFFGALATLLPSATRAQNPAAPGVSEEASAALARMGKTLLTQQFSFNAHTLRAYAGPNGELLHIAHSLKTAVHRPDRLSVEVSGDDGAKKMLYDGKTLVVYGVDQKQYATTPVTGNLEQMFSVAESRVGMDFPLADLLTDNPQDSVLSGVTSGGQVGTSVIDGVQCRHFFFNQADEAELELWLEDNAQALPRRVVVTYRNLPGRPSFIAELSNWDLSSQLADSSFVFQPPSGVVRVEMSARGSTASLPAR